MVREELPRAIGPYRILAVIGQGGMATVYKALHPETGEVVALKVLRSDLVGDEEFRRRLQHEAQVLSQLQHPQIVALRGVGEANRAPYLVMEYLEAPTLHTVIGQRRRAGRVFSPVEALALLRPLAAALDYMHAHGVIHCDLKPENILLTARGPVLTDLGLAAIVPKRGAVVGRAIGTPAYMAPEQIEARRIDRRTDVYALGILLYELLTGRVPFDRPSEAAVIEAQLNGRLPSLAFFNPRLQSGPLLEEVARRALAKRRAERWPSAGAMADALARAVEASARTPQGRTAAPVSASTVDDRRMRLVLALPLAVLLIAALGFGVVKSRQRVEVAAADGRLAPTAPVEVTPSVRPRTQTPTALSLADIAVTPTMPSPTQTSPATPTIPSPTQTPPAVTQTVAATPSAAMLALSGAMLPISDVMTAPQVQTPARHIARLPTASARRNVSKAKAPVRKPIAARATSLPPRPTPTASPTPTVAPSPTATPRKLPRRRKVVRATPRPATTQSPTALPTAEEPTAEQPTAEQPTAEEPTAEQPTAEQVPTDQPTADQPTPEQPMAPQPPIGDGDTD